MDTTILESHLKKFQLVNTIISLVIGIGTFLSIGYGFYFKTTDKLSEHDDKFQQLEVNVTKLTEAVNNSAVFQGASKEQINALQTQVNDVKKSQERIEDKLDRVILKLKTD